MEHIVTIEFEKNRSTNCRRIISIAKGLPGFEEEQGKYKVAIDEMMDYLFHQEEILTVINGVRRWKNTKVFLYGKQYLSSWDFERFIKKIETTAGKYVEIIKTRDNFSSGSVTIESLPLPIVYYPQAYGSFFAFAEDIGKQVFFCECEKDAIENFLTLRMIGVGEKENLDESAILKKEFPKVTWSSLEIIEGKTQGTIQYKKGICFRCNKKTPKKKYCDPMYGGVFMQNYGWYVNQEYYRLGIDKKIYHKMRVMPDMCTPEIFDITQRIDSLIDNSREIHENEGEIIKLRKSLNRAIENSVREQMGFKKIGDSWVSETMLYHIVKNIYPNEEIIRHYRPKWLDGLELDIFVPGMNLGVEYQGIQHFQAIDHWGGQTQLEKQKEHDERKKTLCDKLGVKLVCVNYDEPMTSDYILGKLTENSTISK